MLLHLFRQFFNPAARAPQRVQMRTRYTVECVAPDGAVRWAEQFDNIVVTAGLNALLNNTFDAAAGSVNWFVGLIGANTGTVAITSGAAAITGTGTDFQTTDVGSDITIVGAGAAAADLVTTVLSRSSVTAAVANANASTTVTGAAFAVEPRPADTMATKSFNETTPYSDATRPAWTKNAAASGGAMSNSSSRASFTINATGRVFGAFLTSNNTKGGTTGTLYGGGLFSTGSRSVLNGDTLNVQVDLSATAA
jgi:hypothetical protein